MAKLNANAMADVAYKHICHLVDTVLGSRKLKLSDIEELEFCTKVLRSCAERKKRVILDVEYDN
jgi:hypothetical protein